jgi:uncharacterized alpha-E superfamily protein
MELWERVNSLYLYIRENGARALIGRGPRDDVLRAVIGQRESIVGLITGSMSRDVAYQFIKLGRNMERADMTTRIVDVGAKELFGRRDRLPEMHDNILWSNVLRATSAYQMFRQYSRDRVTGPDVVDFLFKDPTFPRAIGHCLGFLLHVIEPLPRSRDLQQYIEESAKRVGSCDFSTLDSQGLHAFIDALQLDLGRIHTAIDATWFGRAPAG